MLQVAIVFRTPPYKDENIHDHVKVQFMLRRPSDGEVSRSLQFTYVPHHHGTSPKVVLTLHPTNVWDNFSSAALLLINTWPDQSPENLRRDFLRNAEELLNMCAWELVCVGTPMAYVSLCLRGHPGTLPPACLPVQGGPVVLSLTLTDIFVGQTFEAVFISSIEHTPCDCEFWWKYRSSLAQQPPPGIKHSHTWSGSERIRRVCTNFVLAQPRAWLQVMLSWGRLINVTACLSFWTGKHINHMMVAPRMSPWRQRGAGAMFRTQPLATWPKWCPRLLLLHCPAPFSDLWLLFSIRPLHNICSLRVLYLIHFFITGNERSQKHSYYFIAIFATDWVFLFN